MMQTHTRPDHPRKTWSRGLRTIATVTEEFSKLGHPKPAFFVRVHGDVDTEEHTARVFRYSHAGHQGFEAAGGCISTWP